jgi:predicted metal-dependent hydrolase
VNLVIVKEFRKAWVKSIFVTIKNQKNPEKEQLRLDEIVIDIAYKKIKHIHLRVISPDASVIITSPKGVSLDSLRTFAVSKLGWIKKHRQKILSIKKENTKKYISQETHTFLGESLMLNVYFTKSINRVLRNKSALELYIPEKSTVAKRKKLIDEWYRDRLKELIPAYIQHWENIMNVKVNEFGVKQMKTRWGTCNIRECRIWINLELAKKSKRCLEYIIVHEMVHLLEKSHNKKFKMLMDKYYPEWKSCKLELNGTNLSLDEENY